MSSREPGLEIVDVDEVAHPFTSTGLDETYEYAVNEYTGELTVERVEWGPRGNDAWARLGSRVVAAWTPDRWRRITRVNPRFAHRRVVRTGVEDDGGWA
jgi:hypothetical protein